MASDVFGLFGLKWFRAFNASACPRRASHFHQLCELVIPVFGISGNRVPEVHVHRLWTRAARDVLKQFVRHPLVARIGQSLRPRIVAAEVKVLADTFVCRPRPGRLPTRYSLIRRYLQQNRFRSNSIVPLLSSRKAGTSCRGPRRRISGSRGRQGRRSAAGHHGDRFPCRPRGRCLALRC